METIKPDLAKQVLAALPGLHTRGCYRVAYSGGLDSSVLLHMLRKLPQVRAVHINHGMQTQAIAWQRHCEQQCERWAVPLDVRQVNPDVRQGGPEAGARDARYAALAKLMQSGDVLVTAQHADDQAETFLLQALRGAGVRGLAAMPALAEFCNGHIARPLLEFTRSQLHDYAQAHALAYVQDPSNADASLDRAYLRQHILPAVRQRWPQLSRCWSRSAAWCAQAGELADELAAQDMQTCLGPVAESLSMGRLRDLSAARRNNVLRYWLRHLSLAPPDHRHLQAIDALVMNTRSDAQPVVVWADVQLRRYRDWVFAMPRLAPVPVDYNADWDLRQPLALPDGCGYLQVEGCEQHAYAVPVNVRLRIGGEALQLPGRSHHSRLKTLLQSAAVPPWVRARLPLVYRADELVAVADYWRVENMPRLRWCGAPVGANWPRVVGAQAFR